MDRGIKEYMRCVVGPENQKGATAIDHKVLFQRYDVLSLIGSGSSSSVYLAEHKKLKQYRAIKCVPKAQFLAASLELEANLLKDLKHPGIPMIYDIEEDDLNFYIIEEYVQGESLAAFVQRQGNISQETAVAIGIQLCEVLDYLHSRKPKPILYLDLKPDHIMLCGGQLKLIDFGISSLSGSEGGQPQSCGTPGFAAPEQYAGEGIGTQADVYGIGAVLYYMLTGGVLPEYSHRGNSITFPKYCSRSLRNIIKKAVSEKPQDRYADAGEFLRELRKLSLGPAVDLRPAHLMKSITGKEGSIMRLRNKKVANPNIVVGVMGEAAGLGVTHLSLALANYAAKYLKRNVALLEFGERGTFASLLGQADEEVHQDGITYFPDVTPRKLGQICNMDFDCMVLDLGRDSADARDELMRCKCKLVVGSLSPWRKSEYYGFIERMRANVGSLERFVFLTSFEDKIEIKHCRRTFGVRVQHIPYIANPLYVKEKEVPFLHSLL